MERLTIQQFNIIVNIFWGAVRVQWLVIKEQEGFLEIRIREVRDEKNGDLFGPGTNLERRVYWDIDKFMEFVTHLRGVGYRVALTSGTYDLAHVGHLRYLMHVRMYAEQAGVPVVLVVGLDSD